MDFAKRAYDHSFPFDPIVRSLLDTDFYKLLMMQFVWERYPTVNVGWSVTNRTKSIKLAEEINIDELRAQLDHVRTLKFQKSELVYLRGNSFYGQEGIFRDSFIHVLQRYRAPAYNLTVTDDGQFDLSFEGPWWETTLWEIYALTIINEMRSRAILKTLSKSELDITYARAKVKLYKKLELLAGVAGLNLTDFGTRRRHSFLWQEHCVLTACEVVGTGFTGTSNVYLAMKHGLEPKGTNAHEVPMVLTAIAMALYPDNPEKVRQAQYDMLREWQNFYKGNLLICLPDTYGSTQFFENAPQWLSNWKGMRPDSKEPFEAGEEIIRFFRMQGLTPDQIARDKLVIFSDGLDVEIDGKANGADIIALQRAFDGRILVGFGWGTNLTNDFIDCAPKGDNRLKSISIVCKIKFVNGQAAVKLSDNYEKATGPKDVVERYRETFGTAGVKNAPVLV